MNRSAECIASEFGGIGTLTNDGRSVEEKRQDIERRTQLNREQAQRELDSFSTLPVLLTR